MSHHCHDEHDHSGGGGHDHGEHDHSDDVTPALQHSLYQHIDFDGVNTLNEETSGSGKAVLKKTWAERLDPTPEVASDADEQVIVQVPFTGQVKLHSILLRSSASDAAPRTLKLFINRDDVEFDAAAELAPTQTLELSQTGDVQELAVKRALFGKVTRLTLFFEDNFGDGDEEVTRFSYLGFKGEWMALGRAPAQILYEAAPTPTTTPSRGRVPMLWGVGLGAGAWGIGKRADQGSGKGGWALEEGYMHSLGVYQGAAMMRREKAP
ncbi:PITH domain-containing protein [Apiospora phragmitis]|uniref:PITH domain-containing protein n=1 Tax=Apiospora phragmitis TaxID=2905665 RepID=A0ABR1WT35_9PEZI